MFLPTVVELQRHLAEIPFAKQVGNEKEHS